MRRSAAGSSSCAHHGSHSYWSSCRRGGTRSTCHQQGQRAQARCVGSRAGAAFQAMHAECARHESTQLRVATRTGPNTLPCALGTHPLQPQAAWMPMWLCPLARQRRPCCWCRTSLAGGRRCVFMQHCGGGCASLLAHIVRITGRRGAHAPAARGGGGGGAPGWAPLAPSPPCSGAPPPPPPPPRSLCVLRHHHTRHCPPPPFPGHP
jgi:hypothetical protein